MTLDGAPDDALRASTRKVFDEADALPRLTVDQAVERIVMALERLADAVERAADLLATRH